LPDEEFSNKELQEIQQGREEAREGKTHTWEEVFGEGEVNQMTWDCERLKKYVKKLDLEDSHEFICELLDALKELETNNDKPICDLLDAWDESAEIFNDPELMRRLAKARKEFMEGKGKLYETTR